MHYSNKSSNPWLKHFFSGIVMLPAGHMAALLMLALYISLVPKAFLTGDNASTVNTHLYQILYGGNGEAMFRMEGICLLSICVNRTT